MISDKSKLAIMDKVIHDLFHAGNPVATELKKATHRKGAEKHDLILATAFTAMHQIIGLYAKLYNEELQKEEEKLNAEATVQSEGSED